MVDRNLFVIIDNLEKLLAASHLLVGNVTYICRVVVKSAKTFSKFFFFICDPVIFQSLARAFLGSLPGS